MIQTTKNYQLNYPDYPFLEIQITLKPPLESYLFRAPNYN